MLEPVAYLRAMDTRLFTAFLAKASPLESSHKIKKAYRPSFLPLFRLSCSIFDDFEGLVARVLEDNPATDFGNLVLILSISSSDPALSINSSSR